ncbi:hypothetical protein [Sutcliffiella rhizosphaerae]|uniref:EF-hand domain-containing protein n=1 Tax=Sutcliffiella rhizosphaerae TaxID=2880967 RepID=A0ABM8YKC9_9BACI|nr:hypothetical protein [Sutcliffiella rhizosphaerae]CAG9620259.1 hypothetical protein BACCIP111883_01027 [Sutcliffiella rhizosphaerae]
MKKALDKEKDWVRTQTSAAAVIHGVIKYTDKKDLSLVDVIGLTGHAFRINIDPIEVNVAGPTAFPGGYLIRKNLTNLGFISNLADPEAPVPPDKLERTLQLIQDSIDRGIPAITFDLFIPEFGLIYGYDDDLQTFYAKDCSKDGEVSYEDFANINGVLYTTTVGESLPHSKYEMLRMALDTILDHSYGREWQHIFQDKYVIGLKAYDTWIDVLHRRQADPHGNAFNALVVSDAREFAVKFLHDLSKNWDGTNIVERGVRKFSSEAEKHFSKVANALVELRELFPFPGGGDPLDSIRVEKGIELLTIAKNAEIDGIKTLETLANFMKNYYAEKWIH